MTNIWLAEIREEKAMRSKDPLDFIAFCPRPRDRGAIRARYSAPIRP
jgi:hypothetical protein